VVESPIQALQIRQQRRVGRQRRKIPRVVAASALHDEDAIAVLREAAGRHGASEPAADDDGFWTLRMFAAYHACSRSGYAPRAFTRVAICLATTPRKAIAIEAPER
jgi:hypothetical protein